MTVAGCSDNGSMMFAVLNDMLCSNLMVHGLAELAILVFVLVYRRSIFVISRCHDLRGHVAL